jgi:hypothetical protein
MLYYAGKAFNRGRGAKERPRGLSLGALWVRWRVERTYGLIWAEGNPEPRSVSHPISHIGVVRLNAAIGPRLTVTIIEEPFERQQGTEESLGTE